MCQMTEKAVPGFVFIETFAFMSTFELSINIPSGGPWAYSMLNNSYQLIYATKPPSDVFNGSLPSTVNQGVNSFYSGVHPNWHIVLFNVNKGGEGGDTGSFLTDGAVSDSIFKANIDITHIVCIFLLRTSGSNADVYYAGHIFGATDQDQSDTIAGGQYQFHDLLPGILVGVDDVGYPSNNISNMLNDSTSPVYAYPPVYVFGGSTYEYVVDDFFAPSRTGSICAVVRTIEANEEQQIIVSRSKSERVVSLAIINPSDSFKLTISSNVVDDVALDFAMESGKQNIAVDNYQQYTDGSFSIIAKDETGHVVFTDYVYTQPTPKIGDNGLVEYINMYSELDHGTTPTHLSHLAHIQDIQRNLRRIYQLLNSMIVTQNERNYLSLGDMSEQFREKLARTIRQNLIATNNEADAAAAEIQ